VRLLWQLGYPDQALAKSAEAITAAEKISHPQSLAFAMISTSYLHQLLREPHSALRWADAAVTLATEHDLVQMVSWANASHGWAVAELGRVEEGIAQIRQVLAARKTIGAVFFPQYLGLLAELFWKAGRPEEGMTSVVHGLAVAQSTGAHYWDAELYRLKGELLLSHPEKNDAEAEACFRQAIETARRQSAKSFELRAAISMSQLCKRQDKKDEGHQVLTKIYGSFTEGFETADLREAKSLLEEY
jgi:predicted ATPase